MAENTLFIERLADAGIGHDPVVQGMQPLPRFGKA